MCRFSDFIWKIKRLLGWFRQDESLVAFAWFGAEMRLEFIFDILPVIGVGRLIFFLRDIRPDF